MCTCVVCIRFKLARARACVVWGNEEMKKLFCLLAVVF